VRKEGKMLEAVKRLFSKEGKSQFKKVREKVKGLAEKLTKKDGKSDNTEILNILEEYGATVAPFRIISTRVELKEAAEELGCPVMVKPVTSKVISRSQADAIILLESLEGTEAAYAQAIGRIVSSTPWVGVESVMVQQYVQGDEKLSLSWKRSKKKSFPFRLVSRLFKKGEEAKESEKTINSQEELLSSLEGLPSNLQEVVSACHLAWVENPEISAMEVEMVPCGETAMVVDAKITVFG
jgi:hypothetical protein